MVKTNKTRSKSLGIGTAMINKVLLAAASSADIQLQEGCAPPETLRPEKARPRLTSIRKERGD